MVKIIILQITLISVFKILFIFNMHFFSTEIEDILFQFKLFNLWYFISHVLQKLWSMLHVIKISIYNEIITLYILSLIFIVGLHLRSHTEYTNRVYCRRLWHRHTPPLKIMFTYFVQSNFFLISSLSFV
jgi:hypothetical protein